MGEKVHILSDKAFRRSKENIFEAIGNVIITHEQNAIYGEKATIAFASGETNVFGNVRYIGPTMTLYGSEMSYNFNNNFMSVKNARILSDNYVVLGKELKRVSENKIIGTDAEYTTCRDCPESWSVFGRRVVITVGEYIRIWHAFIKVNGVVVMYVPYLILPIKKNRESGLLFPKLSLDLDEGVRYQQPWFWAISDSTDMTLTPSIFGKRGLGSEIQYRQQLADKTWFEVNSLQSNDRIYLPEKLNSDLSNGHEFRHFSDYEHHHSSTSDFNHHFYWSEVNDLDIQRDYDFFTEEKIKGSALERGGFFSVRKPFFEFTIESYYNRNTVFQNAKGFDHRHVQVLPEVSFKSTPLSLLQTDIPGMSQLSVGIEGDATYFKQNHVEENGFIRNAIRYNANPYLDWNLGNLGPVQVKTRATLDYQYYKFPFQENKKYFSKQAVVYETEAAIEFEKIYGLAYRENIPLEKIEVKSIAAVKGKENNRKSETIGELPTFNKDFSKENYSIQRNSYRHSQVFKLKHFFLTDTKSKGSENFENQLLSEEGQFDRIDSFRDREFLLNSLNSRTSLPVSNTLELQWNNSIIKKSVKSENPLSDGSYLRDNFSYGRLAYFNVSQGFNFNEESEELSKRLTRLFVATGFSVNKFDFGASEYYFYADKKNLMSVSLKRTFDNGVLGTAFRYDPFSAPVNKSIVFDGEIKLSKLFTVSAFYDYDIEKKQSKLTKYKALYSPVNNCWKLELSHLKSITDTKVSFNFLINFNENSFKSLSDFK